MSPERMDIRVSRRLARDFRELLDLLGFRYAKVSVLHGMVGLLEGSVMLVGRHFAGEEYRGGAAGVSVSRWPWRGVACRDGRVA